MEKYKAWIAYIPVFFTVLLAVLLVFSDKKEFSENENRFLAARPVFRLEEVKNGKYMENWNDYLTDHFPFRDTFVGAAAAAMRLSGRKEINGVFVTQGGQLIEDYAAPENTERIGNIFREFSEKLGGRVRLRLMLVPTAVSVYGEKLPPYAPVRDQMETANALYEAAGIAPIDCAEELRREKSNGELYYRTDHHWTTFGAYAGYRAYCGQMGFDAVPLDQWDRKVVTEDFRGTLYSKVRDYRTAPDRITVYSYPKDELSVKYLDTGETSHSLYNFDYLGQKDKYSLFLNNLHPLIEIDNPAAESGRKLALIKDSYANSIVPFLAHHYRKIYVFDTRYYRDGPSSFIKGLDGDIDVVLLYNMNTLDTDSGIRGVY